MRKPNIILINVDDLGYGDIGCYGSKRNKTPAIDRMAAEGMLFTDFYAPAPVCTPSRGGLMTGCYPKRIDLQEFSVYDPREPQAPKDTFIVLFPGQPEGLNPKEKTLASMLKEADYATKMIGKWHLGDQEAFLPTRFGFDSYFGIPYSNDMGLQTPKGLFERLKYTLCPLPLLSDDQVVQEQPDQAALTERYTQEAVSFIHENRERPFFLYFAHMYIHHPLYAPQRFINESENGLMGASVACLDWSVSVLEYTLKTLGIADDTLVIFTSDNGGDLRSSNAPLRGHKASTWEGGLRVNCIMKWPKTIPAGSVCTELATMMDFFPTFAQMADVDIRDGVKRDGYSMMPLMRGQEGCVSPYQAFFYYAGNALQAVRSGRYKLHLQTGALYDLQADIGESADIAAAHPRVVERLEAYAQDCREDIGDSRTQTKGRNCRPKGFVKDFKPLTSFDPHHPYMVALYDLERTVHFQEGAT